jgi:hypothetical protein
MSVSLSMLSKLLVGPELLGSPRAIDRRHPVLELSTGGGAPEVPANVLQTAGA